MPISKDPATHSLFAVTYQAFLTVVLMRAPPEDNERAGHIVWRAAKAAALAHHAALEAVTNVPDPHPLHVLQNYSTQVGGDLATPLADEPAAPPGEEWISRADMLAWLAREIGEQTEIRDSRETDREVSFTHEGQVEALERVRDRVLAGMSLRVDGAGAGEVGRLVHIRLLELAASAGRALNESPYPQTRDVAKGARDAYLRASDLVCAHTVDLTTLRDLIAELAGLECGPLDARRMLDVLIPFIAARSRKDARAQAADTVRAWLAGAGYGEGDSGIANGLIERILNPKV